MTLRNVTITIDEELLVEARVLAARRGSSVSALVREQLQAVVGNERRRMEGWSSVHSLLEEPRLEIGGPLPSRDQVHER